MTTVETVETVKRDTAPKNAPTDDLQNQMSRIQELLDQLEAMPPGVRDIAQDCMQSLLEFYGDGLTRILEISEKVGGERTVVALTEDKLVNALLLIHNLHPVALEKRLLGALDKIRPYMESHGGNVELLSLANGFARLRLQGTCKSCQSSAVTMELAARKAIEEACPDLIGFDVEGIPERAEMPERKSAEWIVIENANELASGSFMRIETNALPLLICKVVENFYAYSDRCPACNLPMHLGELRDGFFQCPNGHAFDLQCAGQSRLSEIPPLTPFPLLVENGVVKVLATNGKKDSADEDETALREDILENKTR